jgi:transposase
MEEIIEEAPELVARVAALDVGNTPPGCRRQEVRTFGTATGSLLELRDWLVCQGVTLCVMEAARIS